MPGIEFIINTLDYATAPLKKIASSIGDTANKFTELRQKADVMPWTINSIKSKLNDLENERGLTTSRKRVAELNGQIKGLGGAIQRLEHLPPPGFFNRLQDAGGAINKFGPLIAGAFSISAISSFGQSVLETTSKYQKFEAVLSTQLGSAAGGKEAMAMIQKFAAETPFQVDELTGSFVKLASQGFQPTKDQLTNLGDLAASMGKPFDQLTEAVLDAQTGEFERLKEFGIKAKVHGDKVELTFKGQTTSIDKSSGAMQNYLLGLGKAPGVIGSMAAISATTGGKLSNLGDSVDNLKKGIGEGLKPIIDLIIDKVKLFTDMLQKVGDWMKEHPKTVKTFALAIGIAAVAITAVTLGMWLFNAALWANPITWVVLAAIALGVVIAGLIVYFDGWGTSIGALWSIIKSFASLVGLQFKLLWEGITFSMDIAWLKIKDFFQWIGEKVNNVADAIARLANFDFKGALESVNKKITTSASIEIDTKKKEHEGKTNDMNNQIVGEFKNIGKQWEKVGLTKSKDEKISTVEDTIKKISGQPDGKPKGDKKDDKGKEMATKVNGGGSKPTTINLTIHKLQDQIVVHTTNLQTGAKDAGRQIVEEILMALNSVNGKAAAL